MDDSSGRNNLQDVADYIDNVLKSMQIGPEAKHPEDKILENLMRIYRNDPVMYPKLQDFYMQEYSKILKPDPTKKRWM